MKIKADFPSAYEEIALNLGIKIGGYTIYDDFVGYFKKISKFEINDFFSLYKQVLFVEYETRYQEYQNNAKN